MSLDLAQPRALRPLVPPPEPAANNKPGVAGRPAGEAGPTPQPKPRTAIHVRLTEDVLRELLDMARKGPAGTQDGAVRLDLGAQPALVVNGVRHALSMHPEAPNTELVRLSSASRDLQSIAAVTHRASVQHSKADLDKAGQRARENRELAEKEKDSRRAVLLDSVPAKAHSRSASHNRPTRPHTPLGGPASAPTSRTASPASTVRQPSRLTAVPPKPPTGTTFRIGKGTVPSSIALSRGASSSSSSGTGGGGAASPPRAEAVAAAGASAAPAAARQDSATSSVSSSSETSLLQKASGASVTSPESLPLVEVTKDKPAPLQTDAPKGPGNGLNEPEAASATARKSPLRAGGGLMKGKETLKKEKRREERAKERASAPTKRPSDVVQPEDDDEDEDAPGEPDVIEDAPSRPAPAKKRRLESDERDASGVSSRGSSASRNGASSTPASKPAAVKTKVVTKVVTVKKGVAADRGSGSDVSRSEAGRGKPLKAGDKSRARERREGAEDSSKVSPPPPRKKKKPPETERWYSSSSEDDDTESRSSSSKTKAARRPTVTKRPSAPAPSAPSAGSPLRNSTSAATLLASTPIAAPSPLPPVDISSAADFASSRSAFFEAYAAYAVAHARLTDERHRLERGEAGTLAPGEVRRRVQDVLRQRAELDALREGMKRFAAEGVRTG